MLGYTLDEIRALSYLNLAPPQWAESDAAAFAQVVKTGSVASYEKNFSRKDGRSVPVDFTAWLISDDKGKPAGMWGVIRDISERKRAEAEWARLTQQLKLKNEELEQILFAASHDLRTPLVSIKGFSSELSASLDELLALFESGELSAASRAKLKQLIESDIPESLKFITAGTSRMSTLLSGLLRLSRLGRAAITVEELNANRLVADVAAAMEFAFKQAGAEVTVEDLPPCRGDRVTIGQVFSNLIENALKYRAPGRKPVVRVSGRRFDGWAEYTVEDNGVGIAPGLQKRVFELFHRVDPGHGEGEGLGLTIVTRILDRLDGAIRLESEPGKGSRFIVSLPAAKKTADGLTTDERGA